jgi:hypothetical protein
VVTPSRVLAETPRFALRHTLDVGSRVCTNHWAIALPEDAEDLAPVQPMPETEATSVHPPDDEGVVLQPVLARPGREQANDADSNGARQGSTSLCLGLHQPKPHIHCRMVGPKSKIDVGLVYEASP